MAGRFVPLFRGVERCASATGLSGSRCLAASVGTPLVRALATSSGSSNKGGSNRTSLPPIFHLSVLSVFGFMGGERECEKQLKRDLNQIALQLDKYTSQRVRSLYDSILSGDDAVLKKIVLDAKFDQGTRVSSFLFSSENFKTVSQLFEFLSEQTPEVIQDYLLGDNGEFSPVLSLILDSEGVDKERAYTALSISLIHGDANLLTLQRFIQKATISQETKKDFYRHVMTITHQLLTGDSEFIQTPFIHDDKGQLLSAFQIIPKLSEPQLDCLPWYVDMKISDVHQFLKNTSKTIEHEVGFFVLRPPGFADDEVRLVNLSSAHRTLNNRGSSKVILDMRTVYGGEVKDHCVGHVHTHPKPFPLERYKEVLIMQQLALHPLDMDTGSKIGYEQYLVISELQLLIPSFTDVNCVTQLGTEHTFCIVYGDRVTRYSGTSGDVSEYRFNQAKDVLFREIIDKFESGELKTVEESFAYFAKRFPYSQLELDSTLPLTVD